MPLRHSLTKSCFFIMFGLMSIISICNGSWLFCIVGLDVVRTDRALAFYEIEANQSKLWDVLSIYAWLDNDIGYVQGRWLYLSIF